MKCYPLLHAHTTTIHAGSPLYFWLHSPSQIGVMEETLDVASASPASYCPGCRTVNLWAGALDSAPGEGTKTLLPCGHNVCAECEAALLNVSGPVCCVCTTRIVSTVPNFALCVSGSEMGTSGQVHGQDAEREPVQVSAESSPSPSSVSLEEGKVPCRDHGHPAENHPSPHASHTAALRAHAWLCATSVAALRKELAAHQTKVKEAAIVMSSTIPSEQAGSLAKELDSRTDELVTLIDQVEAGRVACTRAFDAPTQRQQRVLASAGSWCELLFNRGLAPAVEPGGRESGLAPSTPLSPETDPSLSTPGPSHIAVSPALACPRVDRGITFETECLRLVDAMATSVVKEGQHEVLAVPLIVRAAEWDDDPHRLRPACIVDELLAQHPAPREMAEADEANRPDGVTSGEEHTQPTPACSLVQAETESLECEACRGWSLVTPRTVVAASAFPGLLAPEMWGATVRERCLAFAEGWTKTHLHTVSGPARDSERVIAFLCSMVGLAPTSSEICTRLCTSLNEESKPWEHVDPDAVADLLLFALACHPCDERVAHGVCDTLSEEVLLDSLAVVRHAEWVCALLWVAVQFQGRPAASSAWTALGSLVSLTYTAPEVHQYQHFRVFNAFGGLAWARECALAAPTPSDVIPILTCVLKFISSAPATVPGSRVWQDAAGLAVLFSLARRHGHDDMVADLILRFLSELAASTAVECSCPKWRPATGSRWGTTAAAFGVGWAGLRMATKTAVFERTTRGIHIEMMGNEEMLVGAGPPGGVPPTTPRVTSLFASYSGTGHATWGPPPRSLFLCTLQLCDIVLALHLESPVIFNSAVGIIALLLRGSRTDEEDMLVLSWPLFPRLVLASLEQRDANSSRTPFHSQFAFVPFGKLLGWWVQTWPMANSADRRLAIVAARGHVVFIRMLSDLDNDPGHDPSQVDAVLSCLCACLGPEPELAAAWAPRDFSEALGGVVAHLLSSHHSSGSPSTTNAVRNPGSLARFLCELFRAAPIGSMSARLLRQAVNFILHRIPGVHCVELVRHMAAREDTLEALTTTDGLLLCSGAWSQNRDDEAASIWTLLPVFTTIARRVEGRLHRDPKGFHAGDPVSAPDDAHGEDGGDDNDEADGNPPTRGTVSPPSALSQPSDRNNMLACFAYAARMVLRTWVAAGPITPWISMAHDLLVAAKYLGHDALELYCAAFPFSQVLHGFHLLCNARAETFLARFADVVSKAIVALPRDHLALSEGYSWASHVCVAAHRALDFLTTRLDANPAKDETTCSAIHAVLNTLRVWLPIAARFGGTVPNATALWISIHTVGAQRTMTMLADVVAVFQVLGSGPPATVAACPKAVVFMLMFVCTLWPRDQAVVLQACNTLFRVAVVLPGTAPLMATPTFVQFLRVLLEIFNEQQESVPDQVHTLFPFARQKTGKLLRILLASGRCVS